MTQCLQLMWHWGMRLLCLLLVLGCDPDDFVSMGSDSPATDAGLATSGGTGTFIPINFAGASGDAGRLGIGGTGPDLAGSGDAGTPGIASGGSAGAANATDGLALTIPRHMYGT